MTELELYHHGILGQKWGIRRYQNKDGSLTKAGLKRYGTLTNFKKVQAAKKAASPEAIKARKEKKKIEARTQAEILKYKKKAGLVTDDEKKDEEKPTNHQTQKIPRDIKSMSNEELKTLTDRMNLEKNYLDAQRNYADSQTKLSDLNNSKDDKKTKGGRFIKDTLQTTFKDVVLPVAKDNAKKYLDKAVSEYLGINEKEKDRVLNDLKKEAEKAQLVSQIEAAKTKQLTREKMERDSEKAKQDIEDRIKEARKEAAEEARKATEEYMTRLYSGSNDYY